MKLSRPDADIFVPNTGPAPAATPAAALARTTHLCVLAHQDDIEINAYSAVAACYGRTDKFLTGVVMTDGAGSARTGPYAHVTDAEMRAIRRDEQRRAAEIGKYNLQLQLAHPSADVKKPGHTGVAADLAAIFSGCGPALEEVYLHQPADKHDTHVACLMRCLDAIRALPRERRPRRVLGVEGWRDLDWLADADKVPLDCSPYPELAAELITVFASQVVGGKRYDIATFGRRSANATFLSSHATDRATSVAFAMDLTPLVQDEALAPADFVARHLERFRADVVGRVQRYA
jgi:LmbE family N-acetylglucosaminyl deacetylase